ncbi:MAG: GTPase ObgE [Clostridiales bacterium]|nr:GTPase ObgE [Clostridiales bacterium]
MFIDHVKVYVKAGDGGHGCVSFHREKYVSHGGPDGGDGGHGGAVIVTVDKGTNTLVHYRYRHKFVAANGENGKNSKCHGKTADPLYLPVPPGTVIKDAQSGLVIHDMSDGNDFVLCQGGKGGWGNTHFATPTRQVPRFAKNGLKGEEREVIFELKMLADVGLVGLPNVGKSSLLSVISAARPKIANYHFTTISPNLGVVKIGEDQEFVVADIPGLIEGAAEGAGLGHAFLRHIDRCRMIIHMVDISGQEGRDPIEDIQLINAELARYSPELAQKPQIIAANKYDCITGQEDTLHDFEQFVAQNGWELVYISAVSHYHIRELTQLVHQKLEELPPLIEYEPEYKIMPVIDTAAEHEITIQRMNEIYIVEGEWLYNLMGTINFDDRESLMYFQKVLKKSGVIQKLIDFGVQDGDTVSIYDFEFDFVI